MDNGGHGADQLAESEVPAGWLVVVGGEVDGLGQALPDLPPARLPVRRDDPGVFEVAQPLAEGLGVIPPRRSVRSVNLYCLADVAVLQERVTLSPIRFRRRAQR
jgi:hypothetical protein